MPLISLDDAFAKFKSRLELNDREQKDASRRHYELRDHVKAAFTVDRDVLTGSYARHTKTKPLKDVDVFFTLSRDAHGDYLAEKPSVLLGDVKTCLVDAYGRSCVDLGRRSVGVELGVAGQDDRVLSLDAVPAFAENGHYLIPDGWDETWVKTDPEQHAALATDANKAFGKQWKPMVKMVKKWNEHHGKPIKPSFLIEVMALELLRPPFSGGYVYELKAFFATARDRIRETWDDPVGLGTPVSDRMDAAQCSIAEAALDDAGRHVDRAVQAKRAGRNGDALDIWRNDVFGPLFPLS